jgi:hypothetical protein
MTRHMRHDRSTSNRVMDAAFVFVVTLFLLVALAMWVATKADAQPTQAQYDSLQSRVVTLEQILGKIFLGKTSAELQAALVPANELPGGKYPYLLSDYQLRAFGLAGLQAQVSGLATRVAAVEEASVVAPPSPGTGGGWTGYLSGMTPITASGGDIGFQLNTGTVTHRFYANPEDFGLRLWFNYREPYVNGSSHSIASLPQMYLFMEQDGVVSFGHYKPTTTSAGAYDGLGGKALAFRTGGWNDGQRRDKFVSIYGGQVGRGLQFGVSRTNANYPDRFDILIDPTLGDDPVSITLGGQPRNLYACGNQVCWR